MQSSMSILVYIDTASNERNPASGDNPLAGFSLPRRLADGQLNRFLVRPKLMINVACSVACHEGSFLHALRDTLRWLEPCDVAWRGAKLYVSLNTFLESDMLSL